MAKFKEGDRVILLANKEEGWPREEGVVLDDENGSCVVEVDRKYRDGPSDDGLRDGVPYESMKAAGAKKKKKKATKKRKTKKARKTRVRRTKRRKSSRKKKSRRSKRR